MSDFCTVTHTLYGPSGEPLEGARVMFTLVPTLWRPEGSYHRVLIAVSDEEGKISVPLRTTGGDAMYRVQMDDEPAFTISLEGGTSATLDELRVG
jgi:hypothetical protein